MVPVRPILVLCLGAWLSGCGGTKPPELAPGRDREQQVVGDTASETSSDSAPITPAGGGESWRCPAGRLCPDGARDKSEPCRAGYYCPEGTVELTSDILCRPGRYCREGASSADGSGPCEPGFYCAVGATSARQTPSGAGFFTRAESSSPEPCGEGFYCPKEANTEKDRLACPERPANSRFTDKSAVKLPCAFSCDETYVLRDGKCIPPEPPEAPPTAIVTGVPVDAPSAAQAFTFNVGGPRVAKFRYKVIGGDAARCADTGIYQVVSALSPGVIVDLRSMAEGPITVCVLAETATGKLQDEKAPTTASFVRDITAPTVTVENVPVGVSSAIGLAARVKGGDVVAYRYLLASYSCVGSLASFSAERDVSSPISSVLSSYADGTVLRLCVVGRDAAGNFSLPVEYSWTKLSSAPTAILTGAPTGENAVSALNVTVSGMGIVSYRSKLVRAVTECAIEGFYGSERSVNESITDSVAFDDGSVTLCVLGKNSAGVWQSPTSYSSATWQRVTSAPTATLSGVPTSPSTQTSLSISVGGAGVVSYQYKFVEGGAAACADGGGYTPQRIVSLRITDSIALKPDGLVTLCVRGRNSATIDQPAGAATVAQWTKDTTPPAISLSGVPTGRTRRTQHVVQVLAAGGLAAYRAKVGKAVVCGDVGGYLPLAPLESQQTQDLVLSTGAEGDGEIVLCVMGRDSLGNWASGSQAGRWNWTQDVTGPAPVPGLRISAPSNGRLALAWDPSPSGDVAGYVVVRRTGSSDTSWVPTSGTTYATGSVQGDHTIVYSGAALSVEDSGVTAGTTYSYGIFPVDDLGNYGGVQRAQGTPVAAGSGGGTLSDGYRYYRIQVESVEMAQGTDGWSAIKTVGLHWDGAWRSTQYDGARTPPVFIDGLPVTVTESSYFGQFRGARVFAPDGYWLSATQKFALTAPYDLVQTADPQFVEVDFGSAVRRRMTGLRLEGGVWSGAPGIVPDRWVMLGSNDRARWVEIVGSRASGSSAASVVRTWAWANPSETSGGGGSSAAGTRFVRFEVLSVDVGTQGTASIASLEFKDITSSSQWLSAALTGSAGNLGSYTVAVSASSVYAGDASGYGGWRAMDSVGSTTSWISDMSRYLVGGNGDAVGSPEYVQVDFGSGVAPTIRGFRLACRSGFPCPDRVRLSGSSDGINWAEIPGSQPSVPVNAAGGVVFTHEW